MEWKDFATDQERVRLAQIEDERRSLTFEYRRIYDRCRKRMGPRTKAAKENQEENSL